MIVRGRPNVAVPIFLFRPHWIVLRYRGQDQGSQNLSSRYIHARVFSARALSAAPGRERIEIHRREPCNPIAAGLPGSSRWTFR